MCIEQRNDVAPPFRPWQDPKMNVSHVAAPPARLQFNPRESFLSNLQFCRFRDRWDGWDTSFSCCSHARARKQVMKSSVSCVPSVPGR